MPDLPEPLVPAEVDLKDFPYTPIFRARLFGSAFNAITNDTAWRAGVTLWLKSWDQVPAGSLPKVAVELCKLAELGRDLKTWGKVAGDALHGWFECSDGRLYHRTVAEGVLQAWKIKIAQRNRTEAARAAKATKRLLQPLSQSHQSSVTEIATEPVTTSVGPLSQHPREREKKDSEGSNEPSAAVVQFDPEKEVYDLGKVVLGNNAGGMVKNLLRHVENDRARAMAALDRAHKKSDPRAYISAVLKGDASVRSDDVLDETDALYRRLGVL